MRHDLFVFADDARLASRMAPFVAAGVEAGEPVVVVLCAANRAVLGDALGSLTDDVTFIAGDRHSTWPSAALVDYNVAVRRYLRDGATAVRVCGELPACRTQRHWDEWVAYEAILNRAFAEQPVWVMCAYDERRLPEDVVEGARRVHPELLEDGYRSNPSYEAPEAVIREKMRSDATPLPGLQRLPAAGDGRGVREALAQAMARAQISGSRARDMLGAAAEIVANAVQHGAGIRTLRAGPAGTAFVCEITDRGAGLDDPLAGYLPPEPENGRGRGLWVARGLVARLELLRAPEGGTTARLWG